MESTQTQNIAPLAKIRDPRGVETHSFRPHPENPRRISKERLQMLEKSLAEFGDLSGIIFNSLTGNLIGGHQRLKILPQNLMIERRYATPTSKGTLAEGYLDFEGERYHYREVYWDESKEKAAMIAANNHGGEWDMKLLTQHLHELDSLNIDFDIVGFEADELEKIMTYTPPDDKKTFKCPHCGYVPGK